MIKQMVKTLAKRALICRHVFPAPLTNKDEVRGLIRKLAPVACGKDLIRLGPDGDGGYLVPDDLDGIEACFSPGVSIVAGFEMDCARRGMKVFMADKSVESPPESHPLFVFTKKHVGALNTEDSMTVDDWVRKSLPGSSCDLLLQMDIEGAEYETILNLSEDLLRRFRIMVIEFHRLEQIWNRPFFRIAARVFQKLCQVHVCVHIHPNNSVGCSKIGGLEVPEVMEFTFLRADRITSRSPATVFPHPLDRDVTARPSLVLPPCWYQP